MRKSVIAATVLLASVSLAGAQGFDSYDYTSSSTPTTSYSKPDKKFSLFYSLGAGFSIGGASGVPEFGSLESGQRVDGNLQEIEDEYVNLGRGLKMDLGAAYKFHDHVQVLAAMALTIGLPKAGYKFETVNTTATTSSSESLEVTNSQFGLKVLLAPTFRIFELLDVYVAVGPGIYWNSVGYEYIEESTIGSTTTREEETGTVEVKPSFPFIGMLGVEYPVADRLVLYLDACYEAMNVTVEEVKAEKSTFNDPTLETYEKDDLTRSPPPKIPASNVAIRLGVRVPLF